MEHFNLEAAPYILGGAVIGYILLSVPKVLSFVSGAKSNNQPSTNSVPVSASSARVLKGLEIDMTSKALTPSKSSRRERSATPKSGSKISRNKTPSRK